MHAPAIIENNTPLHSTRELLWSGFVQCPATTVGTWCMVVIALVSGLHVREESGSVELQLNDRESQLG